MNLLTTKTKLAPKQEERINATRGSNASVSTKNVSERRSMMEPIPPATTNFIPCDRCMRTRGWARTLFILRAGKDHILAQSGHFFPVKERPKRKRRIDEQWREEEGVVQCKIRAELQIEVEPLEMQRREHDGNPQLMFFEHGQRSQDQKEDARFHVEVVH